jgi:GNAT superfamily N-acetyltransferase
MEVHQAEWKDVVGALSLEAASLGDGVAGSDERARAWWDAGLVNAVAARDGDRLCGYASAMQLSAETYQAIVDGELDPEDLELDSVSGCGPHYWVGIVIVDPEYQGRGLGTRLLSDLVSARAGRYVADVYSPGGEALVERLGWTRVRDGEHPLYVPSFAG